MLFDFLTGLKKEKIIDFYRNGTNEQKEFINKIINQ